MTVVTPVCHPSAIRFSRLFVRNNFYSAKVGRLGSLGILRCLKGKSLRNRSPAIPSKGTGVTNWGDHESAPEILWYVTLPGLGWKRSMICCLGGKAAIFLPYVPFLKTSAALLVLARRRHTSTQGLLMVNGIRDLYIFELPRLQFQDCSPKT